MWREVVPGLAVDPERLEEEGSLGWESGRTWLLAGCAMIDEALDEVRESRWWSSRIDRLEAELERAVAVMRVGAMLERHRGEYLSGLRCGGEVARGEGDLAADLIRRVEHTARDARRVGDRGGAAGPVRSDRDAAEDRPVGARGGVASRRGGAGAATGRRRARDVGSAG